jgi:hypothetical protein
MIQQVNLSKGICYSDIITAVAGDNPSPFAFSVITPGVWVLCTITCARPLKTLRFHSPAG